MFTVSPTSLGDNFITPFKPLLSMKKRKRKITIKSLQEVIDISFFRKFKPLIIYIRKTCKRLYTPKIYIAIDKVIIAFRERFKYTTKLPNKSINEGYKVWTLAEHGYI